MSIKLIQRREPKAISSELSGLSPLLQRLYANRGVEQASEIDASLAQLIPVESMGGLSEALEVLVPTVEQGQRILIVGDFDADGATSCALGMLAFRALGHQAIDFLVPNRFEYGYGLTPEIVELATTRQPDLIITVDNGIASLAGVAAANAAGIPVIVTDHHLPADELPDAAAIVNPNAPGNDFPSKALAGVGVLFYVLLGLRSALRAKGWFELQSIDEPNMAQFLDIVALGTVADVVPLDANNRRLVHHGLQRIRAGHARPGIAALLEIARRDYRRVKASDMGFFVGPRLNAAGRLDDMTLGIQCLIEDDPLRARELATQLDDWNKQRREIESDMQADAEHMLADLPQSDAALTGVCLFNPDWHQGVIGILASRVKEQLHRPVVIFAKGDEGWIKGSARSIPGFHIRDALDVISKRYPDLFDKFGGHAMAAGMTIREKDFEQFAQAFDQVAREQLSEDQLQAVLLSDGEVPADQLSLDMAAELTQAGPWGQNFPEPLFDGEFDVVSGRIVGEHHWKLVLRPSGSQQTIDAIAFKTVEQFPHLPEKLKIAYQLDINEWQGRQSLQLRIDYMEAVA